MDKTHIGRYEITGEVGRGGMATVFHARDPRFDREVAVKILPAALTHDPQFRVRFEREAKTIGLLEHPAIVPVYDFGEEEGMPYIVMRLMSGGSLSEKLENGPVSVKEAEKIITRIGQALDVAHSKGIIHRDLKPGNILFDQYGNAFLSDFGIARLSEAGSTLTGSQIIGTPAYMSPEQIQGDKQIDGRSDIYALGIILFYMLTKEMPFKADTPAKLMMAHVLDPVPEISKILPSLPDGIDQVVIKAMQKDPDDRYSTGADFAEEYSAVVQGLTTGSRITQPGIPMPEVEAPTIQAGGQETPLFGNTLSTSPEPTASHQGAPQAKKSRPWLLFAAFGLIAVVVLGGLGLMGSGLLGGSPTEEVIEPDVTEVAAVLPSDTPEAEPTEAATDPEPTATLKELVQQPTNTESPTDIPPPATETPLPEATATSSAPIAGGADLIALIIENNIWISNVDGSNLTQLTTDGNAKFNLKWLPDRETIAYITGTCINTVTVSGVEGFIACFAGAEFLEGFDVLKDGSQIGISLNRELFVVAYNIPALNSVRTRDDLINLATCEHLAPYDHGSNVASKNFEFSNDGTKLSVNRIAAGATGLQEDQIDLLDISDCVEKPRILDRFPGTRFTVDRYNISPYLVSWDWDGTTLFLLTSLIRNDLFGDMYLYNQSLFRAEKINPIGGGCCYIAVEWSPDGRYVFFAFQDFAQGENSVTVFYYVPFASLGGGGQIVPLDIPPITNPRQMTEAALRPVASP